MGNKPEPLMVVTWNAELKRGEIESGKESKVVSSMGYHVSHLHCLSIEEMVYLHVKGEIQVALLKSPDPKSTLLTSIEIFELLSQCNIPLPVYTVYAALKEKQYRVYR